MCALFEKDHERILYETNIQEWVNMCRNPLPERFGVGGHGWTHSILNYRRILNEGLNHYRTRVTEKMSLESDPLRNDLYAAMAETLMGITAYVHRVQAELKKIDQAHYAVTRQRLIQAFDRVPLKPARTFFEAVVCLNFMWYLDGADSLGRLDAVLYPFFIDPKKRDGISDNDIVQLLESFWGNVNAMSGWHLILGQRISTDSAYNALTRLFLKSLEHTRRPNAGILVHADMPEENWNAIIDTLAHGSGNPALYNEEVYTKQAGPSLGVVWADRTELAYGGCTEFMVQGLSNVGSIDAGINLLEAFESAMVSSLIDCGSYEQFHAIFISDIRQLIDEVIRFVHLNQQYKAIYRPQMIRTLFIDDCLERGVEYTAGGARYNGSIINLAGIANTVNSLYAIQKMFAGSLSVGKDGLLAALTDDFRGQENLRQELLQLPKYGNNHAGVDDIAQNLTAFVFREIRSRRVWRGDGFIMPSTIMFTTYVYQGRDVGATPDGRMAGSPICDSIGPMQGTDREGPTSTLASVLQLPQELGTGTLVLNMRLQKSLMTRPAERARLISLFKTYFQRGGLQIQATVADPDELRQAIKTPSQFLNLIVRIGGYTEYFVNLNRDLQTEIIRRTEFL